MAYDPCNPVPGTNIPTGISPTHHHAVHHVVGRIRHSVHHKYVHAGPPAHAPNPYGCEKHAAAGPGYGHGAPGSALPAAPISKLAALGGGAVALGGFGGLVGGFIPGGTPITRAVAKVPVTGPSTNPVVPVTVVPPTVIPPVVVPPTPTTPVTPIVPPGTPPISVPEPSSIAVFLFAVLMALAARQLFGRSACRQSTPSILR